MTGDTVDCFNCGRSNPSWAQVCRSCGVPMRPGGAGAPPPSGPIPTDRDSLLSIGAALATMVLAIAIGFLLSGVLPEAAAVIETPTPTPSATVVPSASAAEPTPEPTPKPERLPGKVAFGYGLNRSTDEVIDVADTFSRGQDFCHSVALRSGQFGVAALQEEILRIEDDGSLTVVQRRKDGGLPIDPNAQREGFCAPAVLLIDGAPGTEGWGFGTFVLRDYRMTDDGPERLAQGRFTLAE
jgi:hypothetical protein